jgi:hypothetical protein
MTRGDPRNAPPAAGLLSAIALAALLPACGSDRVTPPPPPPPPPATVTSVIDQGSVPGLPPGAVVFGGITTPRIGTLEVIVDWTSPTNNVDVFLTRGACNPEQLLALVCNTVAVSESLTAKPETVSAANALVGGYTLFVVNLGPTEETISYRILLTHAATASER